MKNQVSHIVHKIFSLYSEFGHEKYGEEVSQISHMVQTAQLAMGEGFDEEVIIAAFLHDIGHLYAKSVSPEEIDSWGAFNHEVVGATFLREHGFSEKVADLVEGHVKAKRYLTLREEGYYDRLSTASKKTLEQQGGKMNEEEAAAFEQSNYFGLSLNLRYWDEMAKIPRQQIPNLAFIKEMIVRHLQENRVGV
ncbi:MAG: HDIG domain-containing protein [Bacteroidia bacterium]|nr:HDIG domain-containing protein [Bacteroidota bacterium]